MPDKITKIVKLLNKNYNLTFYSREKPFRVLISVMLSQRTRDENTLIASKKLFSRFDTAKKILNADISEVKKLIKQ